MAKYVIEIPDDLICDYVGSTHLLMPYTMAGHKGHHDTGLNLTPYTEPDRKAIEDEVWQTAIEIDRNTGNYDWQGMTYREAKVKYEAWKKQKDEIRVGDEVEYTCCNNKTVRFIVTGIADGIAYGFKHICEYDDSGEYCDIDMLWKTGRHFDEVEELLQKMRGEEQ